MVTSFLLWFATLSHWLSLSVVVTGALITLSVFLRFVVMGSIRGADGFGTSAATIQRLPPPRLDVQRAPLPFCLSLVSASHDGGVVMRLKPSTDWPVNRLSARLFGAVSIAAFHHVLRSVPGWSNYYLLTTLCHPTLLRSPWPWFADAFSRGGNIFGSDGCQETGPAVVVELDQDPREVELKRLSDSELLLDLPPRQSYPFVVAVMPAEESDLRSDMNVGSVGAVLAVVHVKDDVVALPTQILSVHLKHTDECQRSSTALGPVFVSGALSVTLARLQKVRTLTALIPLITCNEKSPQCKRTLKS